MNEFDAKIHEYQQVESCFSFGCVMNSTIKFLRYLDIRAYIYCILPKPHCAPKSIVNVQNTEDNCFLW